MSHGGSDVAWFCCVRGKVAIAVIEKLLLENENQLAKF